MARFLAVIGAASLACALLLATGCASASARHRSSHAAPVTLKSLVKTRKLAAEKAADGLLHAVQLPPDARRVSEATGKRVAGNVDLGVNVFTQFAFRHAFWRAKGSRPTVIAFLRRHSPPGFTLNGVGNAGAYPYQGVAFKGKSRGQIPESLLVSVVPEKRGTVIRVDAGVPWTYPRSPREVVPDSVREIDIRSGPIQPYVRRQGARPVALHVTDPAKVARIVRWFNALNVVQPDTYVLGCAFILAVHVNFVFRSGDGRELASASVPSTPAQTCNSIQFTLGGRPQKSLVDGTPLNGLAFYQRVERLLDVRFGPPTHRR